MIRAARQLHLYLGLFFAPSIIFFAFTGTLQTFSLHENKHPGDHHPQWIATLASIHKDQVLPVKKQAKALAPAPKQPNEDAAKKEGSREKDGDGHDTHDGEGKAAPAAKGGTGAPAPQRKSPLP